MPSLCLQGSLLGAPSGLREGGSLSLPLAVWGLDCVPMLPRRDLAILWFVASFLHCSLRFSVLFRLRDEGKEVRAWVSSTPRGTMTSWFLWVPTPCLLASSPLVGHEHIWRNQLLQEDQAVRFSPVCTRDGHAFLGFFFEISMIFRKKCQ